MVLTRNVEEKMKEIEKGKRKKDVKESTPRKRVKMSSSGGKSSKKEWKYLIKPSKWFPGKITVCSIQHVITNFVMKFSDAHKQILGHTCFSYYVHCREIVVQSQLIHQVLLRAVNQPNKQELWFNINGRFCRFSIAEFCLVTGLRYEGVDDRLMLEAKPSPIKEKYFNEFKTITSHDVKRVFLSLDDDAPESDVARLGIIYLITNYLFATSYAKVVDHYIFALADDFKTLDMFPWGKYLFELTLSSLKKGLEKETSHYRLSGFLIAFQVWLYECVPGIEGNLATRVGKKYPRIMNWSAHTHPSVALLDEKVFSSENGEINDIDPTDLELMAPYMTGVPYSKPKQPHEKVASFENQVGKRETTPSPIQTKVSSLALIPHVGVPQTKANVENVPPTKANVENVPQPKVNVEVTDDDFVVPPPKGKNGAGSSSSAAHTQPIHPDCSCIEDCGLLQKKMDVEISKLRVENKGLKEEILSIKSDLTEINDVVRHSKSFSKLNEVIRTQKVLKDGMSDIRSTMETFVGSVSDILSSFMDEVHTKLFGKGRHEEQEQEEKVDDMADKKGKGHMESDPGYDIPIAYDFEGPSFDLGVGSTQSPTKVDDIFFAQKEVQEQVDEVIASVLRSTEVDEEEVQEVTPAPASSGLPVKRVHKPSKTLQSPFITVDARQVATGAKFDTKNVVFQDYLNEVDNADLISFRNWFDRGYKPRNRAKFNVSDDVISPPFICGTVPVHQKTWWHSLIDSNSSLNSTHLDASFYYIRQLAKLGDSVKMKATTTDCIFDMSLRKLYPSFVEDPSSVNEKQELLNTINGERLSFNTPWREVEYVLLPLMPTNRAHWMLGQLEINKRVLYIFNSSNKTYRDKMVYDGVVHIVKILSHLLKVVGLWMEPSGGVDEQSKELAVEIVPGLPQQQNGHDCGIFVIKYAQFLLHNAIDKMPMSFDVGKARMELAALLFKSRQQRQSGRGKTSDE